MDGLLVVDKPVGPTSHDVVARVRRCLRESRIGHTGTLDPNASGVLALVVGRATRLARFLAGERKAYEAVIRLGVSTDTYDALGQPVGPVHTGPFPPFSEVEAALRSFLGMTAQRPPAYSAKKVEGRRSYDLARIRARAGDDPVAPPAVAVELEQIAASDYVGDTVRVTLVCSAGFYVRSLAHDLGTQLGIGAHLASLCRTRSGDITLAQARPLAAIEASPEAAISALVPMSGMLTAFRAVALTPRGAALVANGRAVGFGDCEVGRDRERVFSDPAPEPVRLLAGSGELLAMAVRKAGAPLHSSDALLHPSVVLK